VKRRWLVAAAWVVAALLGLTLIFDRGPTPALRVYIWGA